MHIPLRMFALASIVAGTVCFIPRAWADSVDETASQAPAAKEEASSQPVSTGVKQEAPAQAVSAKTEVPAPAVASTAESQPITTATTEVSTEKECKGPKITVGGGAVFLQRHAYRLIQPQNEREPFRTQKVGDPFEYRMSGMGSFGDIAVEQSLNKDFSVGVSFLGSAQENRQSKPIQGFSNGVTGDFPDGVSVLPLLTNLGPHFVGTFLTGNAVELGATPRNPNGTTDTNFVYDTQQYDVALDAIREKIFTGKDFEIDGILGFAYTCINQHMDLRTKGTSVSLLSPVETNTQESLRDNLFGGRVGARAKIKVCPRLTIQNNVIASFYEDSVRYDGRQDLSNVEFAGFNDHLDFTVIKVLSADRFVPRLETQTDLVIPLTSQLSAMISYRFEGLFNVSEVDHPTAHFDSGQVVDINDHAVQIGTENAIQHYIGLKLSLKI